MNHKTTLLILAAVITILGVAVWALSIKTNNQTTTESFSTPTSTTPAPSSVTTQPADEASEAATTTITFTDDGFTPQNVTVKKGTTITVVNSSSSPVEFSSDEHPSHRNNSELNQDRLSPGQSQTFTVNRTGTYGYHDHIDASKTGQITVKD